jgi:hypothetical protein
LSPEPENILPVIKIIARADFDEVDAVVTKLLSPEVEGQVMIAEVIQTLARLAMQLAGAGVTRQ